MAHASISARVWNGTSICRRDDGYVNASAMCKANSKRWTLYRANDRTQAYIDALAADVGIPTSGLVNVRRGGTPDQQGTWIHPRLAVDLARWISPQFAVWMDGWFLESLHGHGADHHPADALAGNGRIDYALTLLHEAIRMIDPDQTYRPTECQIWVARKDQSPLRPFKALRQPELADQPFSFVRQIRPSA